MSDAARCRPRQPGRFAVARAALAGALDRAVDVAAALEVRGYSSAERPRNARPPWSRHDVRLALAAAAIAVAAVAAKLGGAGHIELYPLAEMPVGPGEVALGLALLALVTLPLAGPRSRLGVAHG
jgi:energy-coupling factor transport system permease protein